MLGKDYTNGKYVKFLCICWMHNQERHSTENLPSFNSRQWDKRHKKKALNFFRISTALMFEICKYILKLVWNRRSHKTNSVASGKKSVLCHVLTLSYFSYFLCIKDVRIETGRQWNSYQQPNNKIPIEL